MGIAKVKHLRNIVLFYFSGLIGTPVASKATREKKPSFCRSGAQEGELERKVCSEHRNLLKSFLNLHHELNPFTAGRTRVGREAGNV